MTHFCDRGAVVEALHGRRVALVGSGPGVVGNARGFIDGHDVVVRVNNWKLGPAAGRRTDVFYSFFGASIRKTAAEAQSAGVKLCVCKCPDAKFIESRWHAEHGKERGVDFRLIYRERAAWWFCPTYVPTLDEFMAKFRLIGNRVPTTGFAALLDVLACEPASVYLTGFDFFTSGLHNVNERWKPGNPADPIGHAPALEAAWVARNMVHRPITGDLRLQQVLRSFERLAA